MWKHQGLSPFPCGDQSILCTSAAIQLNIITCKNFNHRPGNNQIITELAVVRRVLQWHIAIWFPRLSNRICHHGSKFLKSMVLVQIQDIPIWTTSRWTEGLGLTCWKHATICFIQISKSDHRHWQKNPSECSKNGSPIYLPALKFKWAAKKKKQNLTFHSMMVVS